MTAFCSLGNSGDPGRGPQKEKINRQPYAAGKFYTADSTALRNELKDLFEAAVPKKFNDVLAIISPHAGFAYSGEVAASAFNQLDPDRKYKNVFVIASSHREYFDGASIYNTGDYLTPLGKLKVDTALANSLIAENKVFKYSPNFHDQEHSLEVQLPFLQFCLGDDINLIPIIVGTDGPESCMKIAAALSPYFNSDNLFVISTDFSHYPSYPDAVIVDSKTAIAIEGNNPDLLMKVLKENEKSQTSGLATSLCGYTSVLSLLYMTNKTPGISISQVQYKNSGDSPYGDKKRVVGYNAMVVTGKVEGKGEMQGFSLSALDKKELIKVARHTLEIYLSTGDIPVVDAERFSREAKTPLGAFVTLKKNHRLRGCIGRFTSADPLYMVIQQMAIASATEDSRFSRVSREELDKLDIEISVLTPMKKIASPDEIILGKHGIYIKKGLRSGTFLPQVAAETGWTKEEFLGHCSEDKAGLGWNGWKDAEVYTYEALVFGE